MRKSTRYPDPSVPPTLQSSPLTAFQTCYIFTPAGNDARSPKRRRTSKAAEESESSNLFPLLLNSAERVSHAQVRWETYTRLWAEQEARTRAILDSFNQKTLDDVSAFVARAAPAHVGGKIPTALVLTGPNIASHAPLFAQIAARVCAADAAGPVVVLASKDAANLKGALKKVIKDATEADDGFDDDEPADDEAIAGRRGSRLLNYDLRILQNWCALNPHKKVVVAVQDTEAFDAAILADLVQLFRSYLDRIPFVLLMGVATSLEIFHEKLPKATIRMMQGEKFDVERAEECLAQVFNDAVLGEESALRLGPAVCDLLMERQKNHTQSIQTFIAALKYAYMSHFYANPLSIILSMASGKSDGEGLVDILDSGHVQAIRNLPSFRRWYPPACRATCPCTDGAQVD